MAKIEIRKTQLADLEPLSKVYLAVYEAFDVGERWDQPSAHRLLSYWYKRNADLAFTAVVEGNPIGGFMADVKPWWDGYHLVDGEIFVHPDHQKQGIGTQLSIALYKGAIDKYNVVSFDTYTFIGYPHPLNWYKSQGFREIGGWTMISGSVSRALKKLKGQ